jgi:4'-phosphopantetheinyl transferase
VIHWLIQTQAAHPDLGLGVPPPGLLSKEETAVFNELKILKRRQDWLLGRWTAKHLLREMIQQKLGRIVALDAISILAGEDGAPTVDLKSQSAIHDSRFTVSISHSQGSSFCATVERPNWPLGADIERIEPRAANFAADFFTEEEQAFIQESRPELVDALVTTIWSAKEAALKAIRQGLRLDTRSVSCQIEALYALPKAWTALRLLWKQQADEGQLPSLSGWWKVDGPFVVTLAAQDEQHVLAEIIAR